MTVRRSVRRTSSIGLRSAGSITTEDLISVLPFGGTFDLVQLKGSTLLRAFEHSVKRYGENTGEFLQVSGAYIHPAPTIHMLLSSLNNSGKPLKYFTDLYM